MYQQKFVNREDELKFLESRYQSSSPEFIVIYGRRRVGKTELMLKFLDNKNGVYFLASKEGDRQNIKDFSQTAGRVLTDEYFGQIEFPDWFTLFESLFKHRKFCDLAEHDKFVLIIDEFPYLIHSNRAIPSVFQKIWELCMKKENIMLVLSGSSVSVMESDVLGYKSPLYGRRTGQWQLDPLDFKHLGGFLPYSKEDLVMLWSIVGGIPEYLLKFDANLSLWDNVRNNVIQKGTYLYEEVEYLLNEEFREPKNYKLIFKAIALGYNRLGEICNYTGLNKSMVSKYLDVLNKLHIVREEIPVTASPKFKRRLYFIHEPFFNFWFRFIYSNRIDLEANRQNEVLAMIKKDFPAYCGLMFEVLVTELIMGKQILRDHPFTKIGRWWHKDKEIDVVALNYDTKEILFVECKWSILSSSNASEILEKLKEKSKYVEWNNGRRKEYFGIIAKKIEGKEKLRKGGYYVFDPDDL
ncbi:MAG: ATP-binding protein [Methanosarcinales archaeon]|nr:ATP-binding protein [Methanosarcinales archaeon]